MIFLIVIFKIFFIEYLNIKITILCNKINLIIIKYLTYILETIFHI